jgi:hypothetical protein
MEGIGKQSRRTGEEVLAMHFWRFSRYEIRDGFIKPASGAKTIRADPWRDYNAGVNGEDLPGKKLVSTPYKSLFDLLDSRAKIFDLTDEEILSWVNKHGLLGILPHEVVQIEAPPRWVRRPRHTGVEIVLHIHGMKDTPALPSRVRLQRTPRGWSKSDEPFMADVDRDDYYRAVIGSAVPASDEVASTGVWVERFENGALKVSQIPLGYLDSFLKSANPFDPPCIGSLDFWRSYHERREHFLMTAVALRKVARELADWNLPLETRLRAQATLEGLIARVHPVLKLDPKARKFSHQWTGYSLLSQLAYMVYLDVAGGRLKQCENLGCRKCFVSSAYQGRYCSDRCRNTALCRVKRKNRLARQA